MKNNMSKAFINLSIYKYIIKVVAVNIILGTLAHMN